MKQKVASNLRIIFLALLLLLLFGQSFVLLVKDWVIDPYSSHGFLIPLICAFLIWRKRKEIASLTPQPWGRGLIILLLGLSLYLLSRIMDIYYSTWLSFIVILGGLILYLYGKEIFRYLRFPLFYLIFAFTFPPLLREPVAFPMRLLATKWAVGLTKVIGIPVMREGTTIHLLNFSFAVATPCSGLRSLISLLALGVIFVYLVPGLISRKILLLVFILPIILIANSLRTFLILIIANFFGGERALGFFHTFSGLILFLLALGLLLLIWRLLCSRIKISKGTTD